MFLYERRVLRIKILRRRETFKSDMSIAPPLQYRSTLVVSSSISRLSFQSFFLTSHQHHRWLSLICPFWACDVLLYLISLSVTISLLVSVSVYSSLLCHSLSLFYLICCLPRALISSLFPGLFFPSVLMASSGGDAASSFSFSKNVLLAPSV